MHHQSVIQSVSQPQLSKPSNRQSKTHKPDACAGDSSPQARCVQPSHSLEGHKGGRQAGPRHGLLLSLDLTIQVLQLLRGWCVMTGQQGNTQQPTPPGL